MIKKVLTFAAAALMTLGLAAQNNITETTAAVGNLNVPACTVLLQKDAKMVQAAMEQYLKDARFKAQKDDDGYLMVPSCFVEEISLSNINLYTKVEKKGNKRNPQAIVTVCVISSDLTIDPMALRNNAKTWLAGFVDYVGRYEASLQMQAEQRNLEKAQRAADKAAAHVAAIEKKMTKNEKKIANLQKQIAKYQQKIKECEKDIRSLQGENEQLAGKKTAAEQQVEEANVGVSRVQSEVDRYRELSE